MRIRLARKPTAAAMSSNSKTTVSVPCIVTRMRRAPLRVKLHQASRAGVDPARDGRGDAPLRAPDAQAGRKAPLRAPDAQAGRRAPLRAPDAQAERTAPLRAPD